MFWGKTELAGVIGRDVCFLVIFFLLNPLGVFCYRTVCLDSKKLSTLKNSVILEVNVGCIHIILLEFL